MKITVENMKKLLLPGEDGMMAYILTRPEAEEERNKRIAAYESGELQKEAERIMKEEIKGGGVWIEN
jgi:hypothetical protein|nr:MAG TPA: hypothetical protein [Caudoviricetes sp.]